MFEFLKILIRTSNFFSLAQNTDEKLCSLINIPLKFVPKGPIDNNTAALV